MLETIFKTVYFALWFLVLITIVPNIFTPHRHMRKLNKLREEMENGVWKNIGRDGGVIVLQILLPFIAIFTQSWPIGIVLFVIGLTPANPLGQNVFGYLWIFVRNTSLTVFALCLIINMQFIHWTVHFANKSIIIDLPRLQ